MMRRITKVIAALGILSLCVGEYNTEGYAEDDTKLVIALNAQPPSFDPHVTTAGLTNQLSRNVFEFLLTQDANLQLQPALAASWNVSEDGRSYTFKLRKGVKFHDGASLTPEDVVVSMERWGRLSVPGKAAMAGAKWSEKGEDTVVLEVPAASFMIPYTLASGYNQNAAIMPASILEKAGDKPVRDIIGTGPYKFGEWVPDQDIRLVRNENYTPFDGPQSGLAGDRTPHINSLEFVFVSDDATRLLGLQTGEYDVVPEIPYDSAADVLADKNLRAESYSWNILNVYFNKAKGLFTNVDARRAVDIGLDRKSILLSAAANQQFFDINYHMMLKDQEGMWNTKVGAEGFNPVDGAGAQELFKKAGYNGEELTLITSRDLSEMYNASVVIQQQLAGLGLKVKIESYDWPTFTEIRNKKDAWDLMVLSNSFKFEPSQNLILSKDFAGWTNDPKLEELLKKFRGAATMEEAKSLYDELQAWNQVYLPAAKVGDLDVVIAAGKHVGALPVMGGPVWWSAKLAE